MELLNKETMEKDINLSTNDTIKTKKTWQQMSQAEKGIKRQELIKSGGMAKFFQYKDSISADASDRVNKNFEKNAATRGMTVDQLRKSNIKDSKKPDVTSCETNGPDFSSGKCGISKAAAKQSKSDWKSK